MPVLGMRVTTDAVTGERPKEWRLGIQELYPNAAPLVHIVNRVGKEKSSSVEYSWFEQTYPTRVLTVTSADIPAASTSGTSDTCSVTPGDAYKVVKGMVLINASNQERVWVNTDPSSDSSITITRGVGDSGATAAWADGDKLVVIGTAHAEGADVPTAISYDVTKYYNYLQTFRSAVDMSRIALNEKYRTGALRKREQEHALLRFQTEMERAFLLGKPAELTIGGEIVRFTGGLDNFISTHRLDASAGLTYSAFRSFMYDIAENGSDEKVLFATSDLLEVLETMFDAHSTHMREVPGSDTFGIRMRSIEMAGLTLFLVHHKDLTKIGAYDGWGFVADMDKLTLRVGDDMKWLPNRQGNGIDGFIGEWLGDFGLELHHEECFGVIESATSYST